MIRRAMTMVTIALMLIGFSSTAIAEKGPFGLGIVAGEPTGINAKYFFDKKNAIDGTIGWSFSGDNDFYISADYLYHIYSLIKVSKGELPLYFGVGGRVIFRENRSDKVGVRVPVGLDYLFADLPIDIFVEIVPVLELTPDTELDLEAGIGARFWF